MVGILNIRGMGLVLDSEITPSNHIESSIVMVNSIFLLAKSDFPLGLRVNRHFHGEHCNFGWMKQVKLFESTLFLRRNDLESSWIQISNLDSKYISQNFLPFSEKCHRYHPYQGPAGLLQGGGRASRLAGCQLLREAADHATQGAGGGWRWVEVTGKGWVLGISNLITTSLES